MRSVEDLFGLSCQTPGYESRQKTNGKIFAKMGKFLVKQRKSMYDSPVFDSKKEKESLNPACLLEFQRFFLFYELW